jgi:phosphatidylglycerophosphate synthase
MTARSARKERAVGRFTMEQVRATYKARDSWWTVLLVDPLAGRLVRLAAGRRWVTPDLLTGLAFLLGLAAAGAFLLAGPGWLVAGAALYYTGFVVDCMDGKIARLRAGGSVVGSWIDFVLDRLRGVLCTAALFTGQFLHTGAELFLFAATGVVFLGLFGYVNGAEIDKALARMDGSAPAGVTGPGAALPGMVSRIRDRLHRRRIRLNLVSGVEFDMAMFVVAPLAAAATGPVAIIVVAAVTGVLLLGFELALSGRFWLAARAYDRLDAGRVPQPRTGPVVSPGPSDPAHADPQR